LVKSPEIAIQFPSEIFVSSFAFFIYLSSDLAVM